MNATHIIATHDDYIGQAFAIPRHWSTLVDPTDYPEGSLGDFEFGDTHPEHSTRIEWDEDGTQGTFEAAVNAAGFRIVGTDRFGLEMLAVKA